MSDRDNDDDYDDDWYDDFEEDRLSNRERWVLLTMGVQKVWLKSSE